MKEAEIALMNTALDTPTVLKKILTRGGGKAEDVAERRARISLEELQRQCREELKDRDIRGFTDALVAKVNHGLGGSDCRG